MWGKSTKSENLEYKRAHLCVTYEVISFISLLPSSVFKHARSSESLSPDITQNSGLCVSNRWPEDERRVKALMAIWHKKCKSACSTVDSLGISCSKVGGYKHLDIVNDIRSAHLWVKVQILCFNIFTQQLPEPNPTGGNLGLIETTTSTLWFTPK